MKRLQLLIVDNNKAFIAGLVQIVEDIGCTYDIVGDLAEATLYLQHNWVHALVVNHHLGNQNPSGPNKWILYEHHAYIPKIVVFNESDWENSRIYNALVSPHGVKTFISHQDQKETVKKILEDVITELGVNWDMVIRTGQTSLGNIVMDLVPTELNTATVAQRIQEFDQLLRTHFATFDWLVFDQIMLQISGYCVVEVQCFQGENPNKKTLICQYIRHDLFDGKHEREQGKHVTHSTSFTIATQNATFYPRNGTLFFDYFKTHEPQDVVRIHNSIVEQLPREKNQTTTGNLAKNMRDLIKSPTRRNEQRTYLEKLYALLERHLPRHLHDEKYFLFHDLNQSGRGYSFVDPLRVLFWDQGRKGESGFYTHRRLTGLNQPPTIIADEQVIPVGTILAHYYGPAWLDHATYAWNLRRQFFKDLSLSECVEIELNVLDIVTSLINRPEVACLMQVQPNEETDRIEYWNTLLHLCIGNLSSFSEYPYLVEHEQKQVALGFILASLLTERLQADSELPEDAPHDAKDTIWVDQANPDGASIYVEGVKVKESIPPSDYALFMKLYQSAGISFSKDELTIAEGFSALQEQIRRIRKWTEPSPIDHYLQTTDQGYSLHI